MIRLLLLVEGPTERQFIKSLLAPYLLSFDVQCNAIVVETSSQNSGKKNTGGAPTWGRVQKDLRKLLPDHSAWVSTMLDFYRVPRDTPGYSTANQNNALAKVTHLQESIALHLGSPRNFIPFLVLHEFEALLFAAPEVIATHFSRPELASALSLAVEHAGGAEMLNHGPTTHPAQRLIALKPRYSKPNDGLSIAEKIGLQAMLEHCPHFAAWVSQLCALGQPAA